jgi:hypothetical protein
MFRRALGWLRAPRSWSAASGQTTAEYALVILGAAAIATVIIAWATGGHAIQRLFDTVIEKVLPS